MLRYYNGTDKIIMYLIKNEFVSRSTLIVRCVATYNVLTLTSQAFITTETCIFNVHARTRDVYADIYELYDDTPCRAVFGVLKSRSPIFVTRAFSRRTPSDKI